MLLAEGEKPTNPERHILIEIIQEPVIGRPYRVTRKDLDPAYQRSNDFYRRHPGRGVQEGYGTGRGRDVSIMTFLAQPAQPVILS